MKTQKHQQTVIEFSIQSKNSLLDRVKFYRGCGANQSSLKSLLRAIHRFAPTGGWCFVGMKRLSEQAGVSLSTVRRGLTMLVGMGLVSEQRKPKSQGGGFKFDYRWQVCWARLSGYVQDFQDQERQAWLYAMNDGEWEDVAVEWDEPEEFTEEATEGSLATDGPTDGPESPERSEPSDSVKQRVGDFVQDTSVVDKARAAGADDELILAVVSVWLANRSRPENRWGPAALHYRLRNLAGGQVPTAGWFKGNRVSPPEVMQAANAARSREREQQDEVSQRIQLIRYGRQRGATNEQINRALAKRGWELLPVYETREVATCNS